MCHGDDYKMKHCCFVKELYQPFSSKNLFINACTAVMIINETMLLCAFAIIILSNRLSLVSTIRLMQ